MAEPKVVGDSPFLKRVLVPFWVVRIAVMVLDIGLYGLFIGVTAAYSDDIDSDYGAETGSEKTSAELIAVTAVIMIFIIACLALDIVCIVKRARRTLSPKFFLIVNVVQTTLWTVLFVLSLIGAGGSSVVNAIVAIVVYLSFLGVLIYASVIFHRHRKGTLRGAYTPAINPALAEQQGLAYNPNLTAYVPYPSQPGVVAYGERPRQGQYEMDTPQPKAYGYPPQTQAYAAQQHGYARYA